MLCPRRKILSVTVAVTTITPSEGDDEYAKKKSKAKSSQKLLEKVDECMKAALLLTETCSPFGLMPSGSSWNMFSH